MTSTDELNDLIRCTEISGDNIIDILSRMSDEQINDYVWCWKERINEEINRRIETGVITPFKVLSWCIRGIGWKEEVVAWEKLPKY